MRKYAAACAPILTGTAILAAASFSSIGAQAQSVADSPDQITEIVVTAQKREQRIQDIPISVTAEGGVASVDRGGVSYSAESFVNLPLIDDRLAMRIGGAYRLDAGYVDNVPGGQVQLWSRSATTPPAAFAPVTYASPST